jgi:large subunit ribosomal protein L17
MRHGNKVNHLGRTASHRKALLSNLASSLIMNKRLTTTVAKAKALRRYVEPILTRAKTDTQHSRRMAFSYLQDKESVKTLFGEVASKIGDRPGGYTRIIKLGQTRLGDSAEMALIELVDFNELYTKEGTAKKARTRRSRRGGKKAEAASTKETVAESTEAVETEEAAEEKPAKKPAKKTAAKKTATRKKKKEE